MKIVMMGASGAVGGEVIKTLLKMQQVERITLLGRRILSEINEKQVNQHFIDIGKPATYENLLPAHEIAICTLGVGQPTKITRTEFLKIDKEAVLDFAIATKKAGVKHFELLSSIGIDAKSRSFYLRSKGELVDAINDLNFERFSIFQPSMILTPKNRYGISQAIVLKLWPLLSPFLRGKASKARGIKVETLGEAIAKNILPEKSGIEILQWKDFMKITD